MHLRLNDKAKSEALPALLENVLEESEHESAAASLQDLVMVDVNVKSKNDDEAMDQD